MKGPSPGSFITAIYRCRDTPRSTKLSKLCREVNSLHGTSLNRLPRKLLPTSFEDLIISRNCVPTNASRTGNQLLLSFRFEATDVFDPITWFIRDPTRIWKQTIKIDKNNVYREEREGEIEVQKSGSFRWGLRVNDKDWSNGEDVTCIGKERLKCKWCLCWIWGSLNDKYVACVCV